MIDLNELIEDLGRVQDEISEGHSLLAPSAVRRWIRCPGSIALIGDSDFPAVASELIDPLADLRA